MSRVETHALVAISGLIVGAMWGYREGVRARRRSMTALEWRSEATSPSEAVWWGHESDE